MPPSSSPDRVRLVLFALALACVFVAVLWSLRWAFEGRVVSGQISPEVAMDAMEGFVTLLYALGALVAGSLAGLLVWIARRTRSTRQWPPSGPWPVPRPVDDAGIARIALRLHLGAAISCAVAIIALVAAIV